MTCCDLTEKRIFLFFFDEKKWKWSHNRDFILLYWPVWPPWHFGWVCWQMCYPDIWIIIRILGYPDYFGYPSIQILKKWDILISKYPDTKWILGMWSSTVSQNSKFTNPKPYRVILYYSGVENSSQISSGGKKKLPILFPVTLPTAEIFSGKNVLAWVSMVLHFKK